MIIQDLLKSVILEVTMIKDGTLCCCAAVRIYTNKGSLIHEVMEVAWLIWIQGICVDSKGIDAATRTDRTRLIPVEVPVVFPGRQLISDQTSSMLGARHSR